MKLLKLIIMVSFVINVKTSLAQNNTIRLKIDSLKFLKNDPFSCNAVTWRIISSRENAIQPLIDKLGDTTLTKATDPCKKGYLRVGDLAFLTLNRIFDLPFFSVTGMQCDVIEKGCQLGVFEYIEGQRIKFKNQVQAYYNIRKDKLEWIQLHSNQLSYCHVKNNIKGRYY